MMTDAAPAEVWRILQIGGFCPYHLQRVQQFLPENHTPCVLQAHLAVLSDILFMDETQFTDSDINNMWNLHS
jgi:hypothetical protein